MNIFEATIEEFEQGTWVADLISGDQFSGSFELPDGSTWTGTKVSEGLESERYYTRVVGGSNKLNAILLDKYYAGSVSLQAAVGDVCREAGETTGPVIAGLFLNTLERIRGSASAALDSLAQAFTLIWWIDRTGSLSMAATRPIAPPVGGVRVSSDTDASVTLIEPDSVVLGASYTSPDASITIAAIRHIRWRWTKDRFQAQIYPVPFLFRAPMQTAYSSLYSAAVDTDHGDGTIDVIAAGRFGVTRVPLLCGVPGAKVTVRGGEQVTLGFFGGDPQKPFAVAMAQNTGATKQVARNTDPVKVTLTGTQLAALASFFVSPSGPCIYTPGPMPPPPPMPPPGVDIVGTIQGGTARISVGD